MTCSLNLQISIKICLKPFTTTWIQVFICICKSMMAFSYYHVSEVMKNWTYMSTNKFILFSQQNNHQSCFPKHITCCIFGLLFPYICFQFQFSIFERNLILQQNYQCLPVFLLFLSYLIPLNPFSNPRPIPWPTSGLGCTEVLDLCLSITLCDAVVLFTV